MSDNIVKHGQLKDIAQDLWNKAKARDIETITYEASTKKIKAINAQTPQLELEVQLTNLVSIDEKAEFKKDVSSNIGMTHSTLKLGSINGNENRNRISGHRGITSKLFVDKYIDHITVLADATQNEGDNTSWTVWAVKKGANRTADIIHKRYSKTANIKLITIDGVEYKAVDLSINESFSEEVYFIVRCTDRPYKVIDISTENRNDDVVNISTPPGDTGSSINWESVQTNIAVMFLVGRESITSLSEKLDKINSDSSKYVLKSETTATGGTGEGGKVVKLGTDGKINSNMIPEIAINRVLQAANASAALHLIGDGANQLQVGDVVVLEDTSKIYIYKGKPDGETRNDFARDFLEIAMGNGTVKTVNNIAPSANGNVSIDLDNLPKVKAELDKKISNITLKADKKKLQITRADGQNEDVDLTEAFKATNIAYGKPIAGVAKTTVDDALVALNEEATKSVKKIHNGTPDDQGNINVVVNQGTTGITMTFGSNGGTPVTVATYMTPDEVTEIKNLFR